MNVTLTGKRRVHTAGCEKLDGTPNPGRLESRVQCSIYAYDVALGVAAIAGSSVNVLVIDSRMEYNDTCYCGSVARALFYLAPQYPLPAVVC